MSPARRALLLAAAAAGYAAAAIAAHLLVQLRYLGIDPSVDTSGGMWAFGDLVGDLVVFGPLAVLPSWLVFRAVRDVEWAWAAGSWAALAWSSLAPLALAAFLHGGLAARSPASPLALADALGVVRLVAGPASLPALAAAVWACGFASPRRRLRWAVALEASGLLGAALWLAVALARARA